MEPVREIRATCELLAVKVLMNFEVRVESEDKGTVYLHFYEVTQQAGSKHKGQ